MELNNKNKNIFIITTYISKIHHITILKECIKRIKLFHPDSDIIILNDSYSVNIDFILNDTHSVNSDFMFDSSIKIEKTKYERCGEVNAYVWACEHKDKYKSFCFIHDSVLLTNRLKNLSEKIGFRPLWYSSKNVSDNTQSLEVQLIVSKIKIRNNHIFDKITNIRMSKGSIVFGCMGIFNISFLNYLIHDTNFLENAYMFNTRYLRCFFERLLYMFLSEFYNIDNYYSYSICGDICNHGQFYHHMCILDNNLANNPFALKVWQGR